MDLKSLDGNSYKTKAKFSLFSNLALAMTLHNIFLFIFISDDMII